MMRATSCTVQYTQSTACRYFSANSHIFSVYATFLYMNYGYLVFFITVIFDSTHCELQYIVHVHVYQTGGDYLV